MRGDQIFEAFDAQKRDIEQRESDSANFTGIEKLRYSIERFIGFLELGLTDLRGQLVESGSSLSLSPLKIDYGTLAPPIDREFIYEDPIDIYYVRLEFALSRDNPQSQKPQTTIMADIFSRIAIRVLPHNVPRLANIFYNIEKHFLPHNTLPEEVCTPREFLRCVIRIESCSDKPYVRIEGRSPAGFDHKTTHTSLYDVRDRDRAADNQYVVKDILKTFIEIGYKTSNEFFRGNGWSFRYREFEPERLPINLQPR